MISKSNYETLKELKSPRILAGHYKIYDKEYTREDFNKYKKTWGPRFFRTFIAHKPEDYDGQKRR